MRLVGFACSSLAFDAGLLIGLPFAFCRCGFFSATLRITLCLFCALLGFNGFAFGALGGKLKFKFAALCCGLCFGFTAYCGVAFCLGLGLFLTPCLLCCFAGNALLALFLLACCCFGAQAFQFGLLGFELLTGNQGFSERSKPYLWREQPLPRTLPRLHLWPGLPTKRCWL